MPPEGAISSPGLYEFAGNNSSSDASDPVLTGTTLTFDWSQIEPQQGQFDWSLIDSAIAPWQAAGKKVILRVSPGSDLSWGGGAGNATPSWVYSEGVRSVDDAGSILPVYWDPPFLAAYSSFLAAYAARYNGDPEVAFVEMGIGEGGETLPDTQTTDADRLALWSPVGYTDSGWLAYIETISQIFRQDFTATAVVPLVDSTFLGSAQHADYPILTSWLVSNGFPMQYDGLTSTSTAPDSSWSETTTVAEQRASTAESGDSLLADCQNARATLASRWLLIYKSDVTSKPEAAALQSCAALT